MRLSSQFQRLFALVSLCFLTVVSSVNAADLKLGVGADITSMDPHFVNLFPNNNIAEHIYGKLVALDANAALVPDLAESWKTIDPTTWEFKLRKGVKFHDGSEFTAADVIFTLDRVGKIVNSPGPFTVYTKGIASSEVVDPYTIRFKTAAPYPLLPNDLSTIYIVSKKVAEGATTEDFNAGKVNIGTGPFKFVEFKRGDRVELARNENYWGKKPAWDKVTVRILPNDPTRVAALLSGDVDAIENIPTPDFAKIKTNPKLQASTKTSWRIIFFHMDQFRDQSPFVTDLEGKPLDKNPLKDLRVRQAISKAIDREAIKSRVMEGLSLPTGNLVPSPMFGYTPELTAEKLDVEGAKKLLAEAGYPKGFGLTLHAPNNRYVNDEQIAQAVAQMLTRIGIQTKVQTMPMNVYLGRASKLEFSFALLGWGASTGESSSALRPLLATFTPEKGWGAFAWGRYSNPKMDALLTEALATIDDKKREALLQQAAVISMNDLGILPIHHQISTWATRKGVVYEPRIDEYTLAQEFHPQ
jgi:peptide/nickel transport system substrate-binding protein